VKHLAIAQLEGDKGKLTTMVVWEADIFIRLSSSKNCYQNGGLLTSS